MPQYRQNVCFYVPLGVFLRHYAWRKNVSGIVQGPLPLFWGVSKSACFDHQHFKSADEIAWLTQQFLLSWCAPRESGVGPILPTLAVREVDSYPVYTGRDARAGLECLLADP
jgi:hypothetical protein